MYRKWSTLVLLALLVPVSAWAQSSGKLAGRVVDAATGEGLPGANVIIQGTQIGTATDINGNYTILGVPVGEYTIQGSFVGFTPQTYEGVEINSGYTRELNFELREGELLQELIVEYERPLIQKDALGAPRVVSGEEIQNLPVRGVASVAALQSGVVNNEGSGTLNVRGGRGAEVIYFVDGVKIVGNLGVSQGAIQEQEMLIGGLPAKYGDAMAGVISVTTKTGATKFFGSLEGVTSRGLDSYGYNSAQFTLGGPIVGSKVGFFLAAQYEAQDDAGARAVRSPQLRSGLLDEVRQNPQKISVIDSTGARVFRDLPGSVESGGNLTQFLQPGDVLQGVVNVTETLTTDDFEFTNALDNNGLSGLNLSGKLNFSPVRPVRILVGGQYVTRDFTSYSSARSIFNPEDFTQNDQVTGRGYVTWTHNVSNTTFYQAQFDFSDFQAWSYDPDFSRDVQDVLFYRDIDDPSNAVAARYKLPRLQLTDGTLVPLGTTAPATNPVVDTVLVRQYRDGVFPSTTGVASQFSLPGSGQGGYGKSRTQQLRFSANATTQLGLHQIEFGGEYEQRTFRAFSISSAALAQMFDDGDAEATGGFDPVTRYEDIPYAQLRALTSYYGYNFNGTAEADDENIEGFQDRTNSNIAPFQPIYYAGYLSDKIEYRDLVVQLGARVDVYDSNQRVLKDPFSLLPIVRAGDVGLAQNLVGSDYAVYYSGNNVVGFRDTDGNFYNLDGQQVGPAEVANVGRVRLVDGAQAGTLSESVFKDFEPSVTFQPRIGVTFPVTDRALFFAHYDVLAQRPTTNQFTTLESYEARLEGSGNIGNPNLRPQKTTEYELGFRQRLGERAAIQLSGFYRQVDDLIQLRAYKNVFPNNYSTYQNVDFGTVKGVEFDFDLRRTNNVQLNANYTLSFAEGTGSDATTTSNIFWLREANPFVPNFLSPLDFDRRHTANILLDYRLGDNEGPELFGAKLFENFGLNLIGTFKSGQPYSRIQAPYPRHAGVRLTGLQGQINGNNLPASTLLNLKLDRRFTFNQNTTMTAFVEVENLLDVDNVVNVYQATGLPGNDGYLDTGDGLSQYPIGTIGRTYYAYRTDTPFNYGIPRTTRIGFRLNF